MDFINRGFINRCDVYCNMCMMFNRLLSPYSYVCYLIQHYAAHSRAIINSNSSKNAKNVLGYRCAATAVKGGNSWLKIDLGMALKVLSVNISLAEDSEVPKTMELRLGNDSDHRNNPLCQWLTERYVGEQDVKAVITCKVTLQTNKLFSFSKQLNCFPILLKWHELQCVLTIIDFVVIRATAKI